MSPKYGSGHSKYCYSNTDILINKLTLKNEELLSEAELLFTTQRLLELQASPILADYNLEHLIKIHYYLFQDKIVCFMLRLDLSMIQNHYQVVFERLSKVNYITYLSGIGNCCFFVVHKSEDLVYRCAKPPYCDDTLVGQLD